MCVCACVLVCVPRVVKIGKGQRFGWLTHQEDYKALYGLSSTVRRHSFDRNLYASFVILLTFLLSSFHTACSAIAYILPSPPGSLIPMHTFAHTHTRARGRLIDSLLLRKRQQFFSFFRFTMQSAAYTHTHSHTDTVLVCSSVLRSFISASFVSFRFSRNPFA